MLSGLDDLPVIADENCGRCRTSLTIEIKLDNFSGWFGFIENDGQMYQVPLCIECEKVDAKITGKIED
jgi:hypothetical protein